MGLLETMQRKMIIVGIKKKFNIKSFELMKIWIANGRISYKIDEQPKMSRAIEPEDNKEFSAIFSFDMSMIDLECTVTKNEIHCIIIKENVKSEYTI